MAEEHPGSEYMGIEEFLNITAGEYQDAKGWFYTLKRVEQTRVRAALRVINRLEAPVTTIVAGSSVYPGQIPMIKVPVGSGPIPSTLWKPNTAEIAKARGHYGSIDLSVLCWSTEELESLLKKRGERVHVPNRVYYVKEGEARKRVFDLGMNPAEAAYKQEVHGATNAYVAVSVLKDKMSGPGSLILSRRLPLSE